MEMTTTLMARTIAAEARGVETGRRCFIQPDGSGRVLSDTYTDGKHYRVEAVPVRDGRIVFSCRPEGPHAFENDHHVVTSATPGALPCAHASLYARRMEREHLAHFDPERGWVADVERVAALTAPEPFDGDPFAGL